MSLLSLSNVDSFYGPVQALKEVSLSVDSGEIVALIGANGAGKSTLLMSICSNPTARHGQIVFDGVDITNLQTHEIARLGIAHVPEGRRIFSRMSVAENLMLGGEHVDKQTRAQTLERLLTLLPRLKERYTQLGGTLSGGEQQMLAIARALMASPRLLLLDEPSLGLAPILIKQIFTLIAAIAKDGMTILLVEQNAAAALTLADRGYVLVNGRVTLTGAGKELLHDPQVRAAYLEGQAGSETEP